MFPLWERNISGILRLTPPFGSRGERDLDAEEFREAVPIVCEEDGVGIPPKLVRVSLWWQELGD